MKLAGMDSSLASRKELAKELNYTGDTDDSAAMNLWLNRVVIRRIADNGATVPNEQLTGGSSESSDLVAPTGNCPAWLGGACGQTHFSACERFVMVDEDCAP